MNPVELFNKEQGAAREKGDPMAALCTVANVDQHGNAQLRTLVFRTLDDRWAIFINATSEKFAALAEHVALATYWPSTQIQYRIQAQTEPVPAQVVADSWQQRPDAPKKMDWYYTTVSAQSTPVKDRQTLLQQLDALVLPDPLVAPDTARGLFLVPTRLERLDLTQDNGVHDRRLWTADEDGWQEQVLTP